MAVLGAGAAVAPAGVVVQALVCLGQDSGPAAEPGTWLATVPMMAGVAPAGCARAVFRSRSGCRRLWWLGYRLGALVMGMVLGAVTMAASVVAGLLGPVAIALYAVVLSVPVWITWYWLVRRGETGGRRAGCAAGRGWDKGTKARERALPFC